MLEYCADFFLDQTLPDFPYNQTGNPCNGTFLCVTVAVEMTLTIKVLLGVSL